MAEHAGACDVVVVGRNHVGVSDGGAPAGAMEECHNGCRTLPALHSVRATRPHLVQALQLDERQDVEEPTAGLPLAESAVRLAGPAPSPASGGQIPVSVLVIQAAQSQLLEMIGALQLFTEPYALTRGGPAQSTLSVVYYIYQNAFEFGRMGKASAVAWFLFLFIFIFTMFQTRMQRRWVHYEAG